MLRLAIAVTSLALGCAGHGRPQSGAPSAPESAGSAGETERGRSRGVSNPLFPERERGWEALAPEARFKTAAFAERYPSKADAWAAYRGFGAWLKE